ncbi:MAG TPA: hypothetical protein VK181_07120 [Rhizobium sp.]|nr:hypothetical protein [Rhizobium sp.]
MQSLEQMLRGAIGGEPRERGPMMPKAEALNKMRAHVQALARPLEHFEPGQEIAVRPGFGLEIFEDDTSPAYVFMRYFNEPIKGLELAQEPGDIRGLMCQHDFDCIVLRVCEEGHVHQVTAFSGWFEGAAE